MTYRKRSHTFLDYFRSTHYRKVTWARLLDYMVEPSRSAVRVLMQRQGLSA